jgi:Transposase
MHFSATLRPNPATGQNEPYYRLKETYRDEAGIVRSRILLSPGFIKGLSGEQLRSVSIGLTYRMEHKNECDLFDESVFSYEQPVRELIESLWKMLVSQNKVDVDITKDRLRIEKERNLLCAETIENKEAREMGAEWSCYQAINQLDIASFLREQEWDEGLIKRSLALLITRTVYHSSEYKSLRIMNENSSVCELFNFPASDWNKHNIYDIPLKFYEIKQKLETYLSDKTNHLFNLKDSIAIFDLTNTFFESPKMSSSLAKFGRSKEKRSDAKLVVLAMVINTEGFIKYSSILEGNTSDPSVLPDMIEQLCLKSHTEKDKSLIIIDAGIATDDNLEKIMAKGYDYLCVSRKKPKESEIVSCGEDITVYDNREQPITLTAMETVDKDSCYLRVNSYSKGMKERSMNRQFKERFEQYLKGIESSIHKKHGTKKYDKVCERIGRAREKYPSIQKYYDINVEKDSDEIVTKISWSIKENKEPDASSGIYYLRTSRRQLNEQTIWDFYNIIRNVEDAFRTLKLDLDLRPIYHQKDESAKAHIFLGLLSYWIVNTIRVQLMINGIRHDWTELTRIMSTQKAVTTCAVNKLGETVRIRTCTVPEEKLQGLYDALRYKSQPYKRKKICSTQT